MKVNVVKSFMVPPSRAGLNPLSPTSRLQLLVLDPTHGQTVNGGLKVLRQSTATS